MTAPDHEPPFLLRRADALTGGFDDAELARMVRRGELRRLQRGTYAHSPADLPTDAAARHRLTVLATMPGLRVPAVVSHLSAAVLHGLPVWGVLLARVHVTRRPPVSGTGSTRLRQHVARVPENHLTLVDGVETTSVTRTVVDVARSVPFESAVVLADHALRSGSTTRQDLVDCVTRMGRIPGIRAAARVVDFADPLSESVGESRSRVLIHRLGLRPPDLQVRVRRRDGSVMARCDFGWEVHRTLGEFDGRVKYGRLLGPGQEPGDVVFREKRREDELRDHRWQVVRWTWDDLDRPRGVGDRLLRAFARGGR
ncbi:type IV toxin-antitoxin system AbiEi family antitoxin domain-containing protein [Geodermatophilus sp. DSM 45219]|uniref:type IV toxin-antitoxin system AbiEi family antitoxin domain-containing protein n=1 Tax=Geodermatophilus sp. DSM 45219 TaxID=1881103 RepID=UPI0008921EF9|nr:type IV toxin-antitoxin system AbiEi family antitoxin domain-containing protein [Geodermatophilus sp. DSM 45219]SDN44190.1 Transcriptional regulator, AbiEi antitoxin, Type IV TA system [Geodermatophilus sp. DSM 45219]